MTTHRNPELAIPEDFSIDTFLARVSEIGGYVTDGELRDRYIEFFKKLGEEHPDFALQVCKRIKPTSILFGIAARSLPGIVKDGNEEGLRFVDELLNSDDRLTRDRASSVLRGRIAEGTVPLTSLGRPEVSIEG